MEINSLAQQYIYWPELKNGYQNNIDISQTAIGEIAPLIDQVSSSAQIKVEEIVMRFYGFNEVLSNIRYQEKEVIDNKALKLYEAYCEEIGEQSKKIFSYLFTICIMELRHCHDYHSLEKNLKTKQEEEYFPFDEQEAKETIASWTEEYHETQENLLSYYYKSNVFANLNPEESLKKKEDFALFHEMIKEISNMTSYSRDEIQGSLIPLLESSEYRNLKIGDMLEFSSLMFSYNHFSMGYGGDAWDTIADHNRSFVKGEINAEVFIDQALSLEHNNGQIFNKNIIFGISEKLKWSSCSDKSYDGKKGMYPNFSKLETSQIFLNAQHKGQLLSILSSSFSNRPEITDIQAEYYKGQGFFSDMTTEDFKKLYNYMAININNCDQIIDSFKNNNRDFIKLIEQFPINTPKLDFAEIMDGVKIPDYGNCIELDEASKKSHKLINFIFQEQSGVINNNQGNNKISSEFSFLSIGEIPEEKLNKEYLGNKALGLAQMKNLLVPKAIVFPTPNANLFQEDKSVWLKNLDDNLDKLQILFQDSLVSVRSGSAISMPGMMDTVLNVGISDSNYQSLCDKMTKEVVDQCAIKFMELFSKSLFGYKLEATANLDVALNSFKALLITNKIYFNPENKFPLSKEKQYRYSLEAVFGSWNSERAKAYREHNNIADNIGTAAIVQKMVFGNLNENSCTGVIFSRDCISGEKGVIGEFLIKAQGEDVVSGSVTPKNISEMESLFPEAYKKLISISENLEKQLGDIQDIEFTVEDGELYILQKRKAVCSAIAEVKLNQELYKSGLITKEKMINSIKLESLVAKDVVDIENKTPLSQGLVGNPGVMRGIVVTCEEDMITYRDLYDIYKRDVNFGWIFYALETSPNHAPFMIKTDAFVTSNGGFTSHAAILARSWEKPCVVGIKGSIFAGSIVTLDANNGKIYDGILPLKESSDKDIAKLIKTVLEHYDIQIIDNQENVVNKKVKEINQNKTWMENYIHEVKNVKKDKIVNIRQKMALLLIKNKEDIALKKLSI